MLNISSPFLHIAAPFIWPIIFSINSYKNIYHKLSIPKENQNQSTSQSLLRKGDPDYNSTLKKLPGTHIKDEIQAFLSQEKIRKDLIIFEKPNVGICCALGTNQFHKGDAVILMAPGLYDKDKEAYHWVLKHEISHIKHNDLFTYFLVGTIASLAPAVFNMVCITKPSVPSTYFLTNLAGLTTFIGMSTVAQWREAKADDFAIKNSSNNELLGGRRLLIAFQQMYLQERQTSCMKILISSSGNNRVDFLHPSITSRIEKIEKAIEKRGIIFDKEEEARKIEKLKITNLTFVSS